MRTVVVCFIIAGLALSLSACGSLKPMTLSNARGLCITYSEPDQRGNCGADQNRVCSQFFDGMEQFQTYEECFAHCQEVNRQVIHDPTLQGCNLVRKRAEQLCRDYCNDNFRNK